MKEMTLRGRIVLAVGMLTILIVPPAAYLTRAQAQQAAPAKPPFQVAIEQQLGAETVQRIMFGAQIEQLNAAVQERDRTIADLRKQLADATKKPEDPPK